MSYHEMEILRLSAENAAITANEDEYGDLGGQAEISADGLSLLMSELELTKKQRDALRKKFDAERKELDGRFEDFCEYFPAAKTSKSWVDIYLGVEALMPREQLKEAA